MKNRICETATHLNNAWVAVQTRVFYEKIVAEQLSFNEHECFLPLRYKEPFKIVPDLKGTKEPTKVPLFPGYLFCRYKLNPIFHIRQASGVKKILCRNGIPEIIPDNEIESIQKIVNSGFHGKPCSLLKVGLKVRVHSGPFNGAEGYLVSVNKNKYKIAFGISLIEQAIVVTVVGADVRTINQ